ncbi:FecR family protein [Sphingobacterium psychroaquaticum]|uniref:FecR family protein n=1 Tax=Sphingobacterium psychroaquaticum TaxID=561061 RepID=A0A1X7HW00_9SPHI|nr:FecR domain-containing protein [Sphingobacterium psychroaquaticum]SMG06174.1 FecR family protein [Sphingobacterium psychroaquaticum]
MDHKELHDLMDKYMLGTASREERSRLLTWYRQQPADDLVWKLEAGEDEEQVRKRIKANVWQRLEDPTQRASKAISRTWYLGAVAAVLLAVLGFAFWKMESPSATNLIAETPTTQVENRFVLLPDSSRVVLRPGSRLVYRTDFSGDSREVELIGEAYFDISHRAGQPFIIHTGAVKTVVLGTAFTIRANPNDSDVQVTVQRGKVRVERDNKTVAELTANQQVDVHEEADKTAPKEVHDVAETAMRWAAQDVSFDWQPFGELTAKLERRYGVVIKFKNEKLANCPVSGAFSGIETLDELLPILCTTRNATYRKEGKIIEINGQGCN